MSDYQAESCELKSIDTIKHDWMTLQAQSDCSYFVSWGWIEQWLQLVITDFQPRLLRVTREGQLVGLAIFIPRYIRRRMVFRANALLLHEYPFDNMNMSIEYNGILAFRGYESGVYHTVIHHLRREYNIYDEFHFGAIEERTSQCLQMQARRERFHVVVNETSRAWQIDLQSLQPGIDAFLATLSKNRRTQIRRSLRDDERHGPVTLAEAQDVEQALEFFDALKVMHTQRRTMRGDVGAFANPFWERFHRSLIRARFDAGEIQMIRVGTAGSAIGYLYNFVWRRHVYVLQTGFRQEKNKHDLPGYSVHVYAVSYNRDKGMAIYDFMHGDSLYKRILCKQSRTLCWVVLQRRSMQRFVENTLVGLVRRVKGV